MRQTIPKLLPSVNALLWLLPRPELPGPWERNSDAWQRARRGAVTLLTTGISRVYFRNERSIQRAASGDPVPRNAAQTRTRRPARAKASQPEPARTEPSRYDRRLGEILHQATEVFCEKGFSAASIRDISRASGVSLAGLYYYFKSKDHLLFLIQREAFSTLLEGLESKLQGVIDPERAIQIFIANHLAHFVTHRNQAQVLSHESDTLKGAFQTEITALKRKYYRQCLTLVERLKAEHHLTGMNPRLAVLSLFGMMNWIYTWYNPAVDGDWPEIADQMTSIFLKGTIGGFA
jgi:AcrR family transcriptional regulator